MSADHISPWQPEQNRLRLAVLGKLIEELNELSARAARCILQGIDEIDPDSGRSNRQEMRREVADVGSCLIVLEDIEGIGLDAERCEAKLQGYRYWHKLIDRTASPPIPDIIVGTRADLIFGGEHSDSAHAAEFPLRDASNWDPQP